MPVLKSLGKIQKASVNKNIHPKGRKFKQLNRATLREKTILKKKLEHVEKKSNELMSIKFFQDIVSTGEFAEKDSFSLQDVKEILLLYINRDDAEVELLKLLKKPGRPTSNKQLLLENRKKQELNIFETGWYLPDLLDPENVKNLRNWNGTFGGNNNIKKILIKKNDTEEKFKKDSEMVIA